MNSKMIMGALLGVVVGDALDLPVQFESRAERKIRSVTGMEGWGVFNMPPGSFSDDGSLTLCLAESICETGLNPEDAAQRFLRWFNEGYWTLEGFAYDIGNSTHLAMEKLIRGVPATEAGPQEEIDNGNGSLMRILPAVFYLVEAGSEAMADGKWSISRITHGHPRACSACYICLDGKGATYRVQPKRGICKPLCFARRHTKGGNSKIRAKAFCANI